ncbi:MAG: hypothetical protein DRP11_02525, partial [Candidatus Aenigmatarchaeota archaeon]
SRRLAPKYKRKAYTEVKKLFARRQITVISGLRRVGKSTLMYQLIDELLKDKRPERILYFSFDERVKGVLDVLKEYSELTGVDWRKEKCFLFFDEIQKLPDWSNKIKIIYDNFPNLKITVSGSSSFHLEREAKMNLAGRHFVVNLEPLNFVEYLEMRKSRIDLERIKLWEEDIKKEFKNYLLKPFPEIVGLKESNLIKSYIKDNVIEKVLKIDLPERFKDINEELLVTLVEIFYDRPGMYINYDEISKELRVSKKKLFQHVHYLEFAYIIRRVKNFRPKIRVTSRKLQRVYPFHWALRFGWNGKIDSETIVASLLDAKYYWRKDGKEVDFLKVNEKILPVEVKESSKVRRTELKSLIYFMRRFNLKEGLVIYNGEEETLEINSFIIKKTPIWKLFLAKR